MNSIPNHEWVDRAYEREPFPTLTERLEWVDKKKAWLSKMLATYEAADGWRRSTFRDYYINQQSDHPTFQELRYSVEGGWGPVPAVSLICKRCSYIRSSAGVGRDGMDGQAEPVLKVITAMRDHCPDIREHCPLTPDGRD